MNENRFALIMGAITWLLGAALILNYTFKLWEQAVPTHSAEHLALVVAGWALMRTGSWR